jgi:adenine modification enzyme
MFYLWRNKQMEKGYIYSDQSSLFGSREIIGFGDDELQVKEIHRDLANETIRTNHYSRKIYNATYIHLGVFLNQRFVGVLQYGYAMNPASGSSVVAGTEMDQYLELNRMWLSDEAPRNTESRALSHSFKFIRGKYPRVKWIQSFADERCGGFGIVYQACSFGYYGEHVSDFWEYNGEVFHNIQMTIKPGTKRYSSVVRELQENKDKATRMTLRQFRYIKFLDQRWKSKCLLKEKKYLKHYNND